MIHEHKIWAEDGNGIYSIFKSTDFEYVNPKEYYADRFIFTNKSIMKDAFLLKNPDIPSEIIEKFIHYETIKKWLSKHEEIKGTIVPQFLLTLLTAKNKKEQISLLKNSKFSPEQLIAFIFKSWEDYGFSYSQYTSEKQHKGLDITKMPILAELKDGKVIKVGKTSLSEGQLKQAINHRKVVVAKFFDKKNSWHCFFLTFDSLKGNESWKGGQAHYHYISDKFGIPREEVVKQLKSCNYNLGSLPHIDLIGYRDN